MNIWILNQNVIDISPSTGYFSKVYKYYRYCIYYVLNIIPERLSPYFWFIWRVAPFSFWRPPRSSVRIQKRTTSSILSSPTRSKHILLCNRDILFYILLFVRYQIKLISNKLPGQGLEKELEMSLKTLQNNISAIQERKKFDIASIMAAQTAQQNQEIIGKLIDWLKSQTLVKYFSIVCFNEKQGSKIL